MEHPSADIIGSMGDELKGKRIVLGITGSVSCYRAPDIARSLMRHGAEVHAVMTPGSAKIIQPSLMEWATGNPVVTDLSGRIEHVEFTTGKRKADLILVAPATANTIGKIASGIDDTPVTSYVSSALGARIPILIAPAMHDTMLEHSIIQENIDRLRNAGVRILEPTVEEGKAKLADVTAILEAVISELTRKDMAGLQVLITGGPTVERIDPVRLITNRSSGKMSVSLAREARRRGAAVTLVYGPGSAEPPSGVRVVRVNTADEMLRSVEDELSTKGFDVVVACAAVSDYRPVNQARKKIPTSQRGRLTLELESTPKVVERVKTISPSTFLVIFKAEHNLSRTELIRRAVKRSKETKADLAVVNDVGREDIGFGSESNEVTVIDASGKKTDLRKAPKAEIAGKIMALVVAGMKHKR